MSNETQRSPELHPQPKGSGFSSDRLMNPHQLGCEIEAIAQQIDIQNTLDHKEQIGKLVQELMTLASQIK